MTTFSAKVSIIMPLLNEATLLTNALQRLRAISAQAEVLVVDGGSTDGSRQLAEKFCPVITIKPAKHDGSAKHDVSAKHDGSAKHDVSAKHDSSCRARHDGSAKHDGSCRARHDVSCRARQCNIAAKMSKGDWLLFLHVDSSLPASFLLDMAKVEQQGGQAGAFRLCIRGRHPLLGCLNWGANWRSKRRNIVLGDQACFIKRELFTQLGGFPSLPLMEDYALSLLVKKQGIRWHLTPSAVQTSDRRWQQNGFWRTWWQFRLLFYQFHHQPHFASMLKQYPPIR